MFIDIDCVQEKKYKQNAFGDYFVSKRYPQDKRLIAVLSDGLGSGIKANILSCMTATMLLRFIEKNIKIKKAAEIVMNSLPVCQVRHISYSTFSAIDCFDDGKISVVEEGNPDFVWIRGTEVLKPEFTIIDSVNFKNRHMKVYKMNAQLGDRFVFCSDGVTQAGLGGGVLKLGLRRSGLIDFLKIKLANDPEISSHNLAKYIVQQAKLVEPNRKPIDDISACVLYFREPRKSLVFTGPPYRQSSDREFAYMFKNFVGKKAVCGGTTANLLSRELNAKITVGRLISIDSLPSCLEMEGADLVTEGVLTLTRTLEYLENKIPDSNNAAVRLSNFFLDSDEIYFMVGAKLNEAHYDPTLPVEIAIRKNIVKKIAEVLEKKYFKKVYIQYM